MKCSKCNNQLLNNVCIYCKLEESKIKADINSYKKTFYISSIAYLTLIILNKYNFNYYINGTLEIFTIILTFILLYVISKAYKKYPKNKFFKTILIIFITIITLFLVTKVLNYLT